ncbi:DsbA family oxidoreductase [Evansella sp. AB-P1]|uniref:DsbA family oxidoreductase n=1 Tax=Evansella sp. AB-P1 TaxID=3037653 RepID=UPI0024203CA3|nr:DsbA family oxidoreductase [Evansella sp. AB-P1]MDG5787102.1 DsbA family oxidoreductase [Evansella sp. AB-P1]
MGKRRLEDALKKIDQSVEVTYRSFQLEPTIAKDVNYNIYEKLASKYGMSIEQAKGNVESMVQMARSEGLEFQMDTQILTNTFDAHRLTIFAKNKGLMHEMTERILKAYFTESKHIGDHESLMSLAEDVGLDRKEVNELLNSNKMEEEVLEDIREATQLGIQSVPFFLINRKYSLTGAQPTDVFVLALEKILNEYGANAD